MTLITLQDFYVQNIGKSIDTDGVPESQPYQCVDVVKKYMRDCYGIPYGAYGNAIGYWTNTAPIILTKFDKLAITSNFKEGDIFVWGDDAGNWTGEFGHIGIDYQGKLLNQNNAGRPYVTLDNFFVPGLLGVLRPKEASVQATPEQIKALYLEILGIMATQTNINNLSGKTYDQVKIFLLENKIISLKKELEAGYIQVTDIAQLNLFTRKVK